MQADIFRRRRPAPQAQDSWSGPATKTALVLISFFSNGNFGGGIVPFGEDSNFQQYVGLALWIIVAAISAFRRPVLRFDGSAGLIGCVAFYGLAVVSALWSGSPAASLSKAAALGIIAFSAYRLVLTLDFDEIVESLLHGLAALCLLSLLVAVLVPSIGVDATWMHAGAWQGVFVQKQSLGVCAALLLFFSASRLIGPFRQLWRARNLYYGGAAALAVVCAAASGSRGGGAMAALAVTGIYFARASSTVAKAMAFFPFAMCLLGAALIAYFVQTGAPVLLLFDTPFDFTERTFIWQHALRYFWDAPWLGFGINGFWTLPEVKALFIERHRWFLSDYHNGYIGIVTETGMVGYAVFAASYWFYGRDVRRRVVGEGAASGDFGLALVYTCLMFLINFTELFFMRSTNVQNTMIIMSFFVAYAWPVRRAQVAAQFDAETKRRRKMPLAARPRGGRFESPLRRPA